MPDCERDKNCLTFKQGLILTAVIMACNAIFCYILIVTCR